MKSQFSLRSIGFVMALALVAAPVTAQVVQPFVERLTRANKTAGPTRRSTPGR